MITPDEAAAHAAAFSGLPFEPFDFFDYKGRREVVAFGFFYYYGTRRMQPAAPIPAFLERRRRAKAFGRPGGAFAQVLINPCAPCAPDPPLRSGEGPPP